MLPPFPAAFDRAARLLAMTRNALQSSLSVRVRNVALRSRGFTLIEVMLVVLIISVLAVIAVPAVSHRMRDRRTLAAAQEVSTIFRNARLRALGRGAAVLVRFTTAVPNGTLEVREAVRGSGVCQNMPTVSCTSPQVWDNTDSQTVTTFSPGESAGFRPIYLAVKDPAGNAQTSMDVCFTPLGRSYIRFGGDTLASMTGVPLVRVWRDDGDGPIGLERVVLVPPTGIARLGTAK